MAAPSSDDIDENDLLNLLGLDNETLEDVYGGRCAITEVAESSSCVDYSVQELETLIGEWCGDPDSPFEDVPRRADGRPDLVSAIVTMFNSLEQFSYLRSSPDDVEGCAYAVPNGDLALAGLFVLHTALIQKGNDTQRNNKKSVAFMNSPVLASEFMKASETGTCVGVKQMVESGLVSSESIQDVAWVQTLREVVIPFRRMVGQQNICRRKALPFHEADLQDSDSAKFIGLGVASFLHGSSCGGIDVGETILNAECSSDEDVLFLPHFAALLRRRALQHDALDESKRFEHFCDALFLKIARTIKSRIHASENGSFFLRAHKRALTEALVVGMTCAAVTALQTHNEALISTIREANPALLVNIPDEVACYLFDETLMDPMFNNYKSRERPPGRSFVCGIETLQPYFDRHAPYHGQLVTADKLVPVMDAIVFPFYREYVKSVSTHFYYVEHRPTPQSDIAMPTMRSVLQTERLPPWQQIKDTPLGVRTEFGYIQTSNAVISKLRAVCKSYAAYFKDYVFRPHVEITVYDESVADIFGSPSLRGAPAMGLNFQSTVVSLNVYLRRKIVVKDKTTGRVDEGWQYMNPSVLASGCNCIKVTAETEPDENGRSVSFPVRQRNSKGCMRGRPRTHWQETFDLHHIEAESLPADSVYSLQTSSHFNDRSKQYPGEKFVTLWDKKISGCYRADPIARSQALQIKVRCGKTSASLASTPSAPIRAIRYRVTYGKVQAQSVADDSVRRDAPLLHFDQRQIQTFAPIVAGTSEFHYVSNISLKPDAVSKRADKRKMRTESERRQRQASRT